MIGAPHIEDVLSIVSVPECRAAVVADLDVAGLYLPAGPGPEPIAGDFYDVLPLVDGQVGLVLGDVTGHGIAAVRAMQQLRYAARVYAAADSAPASVLARLDAFVDRADGEALATLWYGLYVPATGSLTYASAGHPPPARHTHHEGAALLAVADAPPLGTGLPHPPAREHATVLPPGAVLVAYSDGLVERRGTDFGEQLDDLARLVARVCDPARDVTPEQIAAEIMQVLVPDPAGADDDICLLVVRRDGTAAPPIPRQPAS